MYAVHIILLTGTMIWFNEWHTIDDPVEDDENTWQNEAKVKLVWGTWTYNTIYNIILLHHEYKQMLQDGWGYFTGSDGTFNLIDLVGGTLCFVSLALIGLDATDLWETTADITDQLDVLCSQALLLTWFKILFFMRGLSQTAYLVHMLVAIVKDIKYFLLVLVIILFAFGVAFFLLLRHNSNMYDYTEDYTLYDSPIYSTVAVYNIMCKPQSASISDLLVETLAVPDGAGYRRRLRH